MTDKLIKVILSKKPKRRGSQGKPLPQDPGGGGTPAYIPEDDLAPPVTLTVEFYEIATPDEVYAADMSETIMGIYDAAYKAWYLSLGNSEDDFNRVYGRYVMLTGDAALILGGNVNGAVRAGTSLTISKTKAIDAAILAQFDPDNATSLTPYPGEYVADTFAIRTLVGDHFNYSQGLTSTRLEKHRSPYTVANYQRNKQKDKHKGKNEMLFPHPPRGAGLRVGDNETWTQFNTKYDPDFPSVPGQDGFKVTKLPHFDAPRVDLSIGGGRVKVYFKRVPRIFSMSAIAHGYFPYGFWQAGSALFDLTQQKSWQWGGQFSVTREHGNWFRPTEVHRTFSLYWQSQFAGYETPATGINAFKTEMSGLVNDRYAYLLEQDGYGNFGDGYNWFPDLYTYVTKEEAHAGEEEGVLPRLYPEIPHDFYLDNGGAGISSSQWRYEGEFVGALEYHKEIYYVWRYTRNHRDSFIGGSYSISTSMSNPAWELEPSFIYTDENNGFINTLGHSVPDTHRPQYAFIRYDRGGFGTIEGYTGFNYQPKYVVDFEAKPRRYQT